MASHIYSHTFLSVWHLIIIFFWYLSVLPAVAGGCRERWGWFCGGGLLLDLSDGGVNSATLLGRRCNLEAVAG